MDFNLNINTRALKSIFDLLDREPYVTVMLTIKSNSITKDIILAVKQSIIIENDMAKLEFFLIK